MTILVSIQQPVEAWQIPAAQVTRLRARFPQHEFVHATDAASRAEGLARCEVAFTWTLRPDELATAPRLRWVHTSAVAAGTLCLTELAVRGVPVSNSRGIQARPIAEHVFACLLALSRQLPHLVTRQTARRWAQNELTGARMPWMLRGRTMGVVGLGSIGSEVARLAAGWGLQVIGVRRRPEAGAPAGVARVVGPGALAAVLAESDIVVLAAPLTGATDALIDHAALDAMKPGAVLVNVARGGLVDTDALVAALASGRLRAAALDVFEREPLAADHPLWQLPNVLITPHTSGFRDGHWDDVVDLFADQLQAFERGAPLRWVVDPAHGY